MRIPSWAWLVLVIPAALFTLVALLNLTPSSTGKQVGWDVVFEVPAVIALGTAIYIAPWIVAEERRVTNLGPIIVINLLLGWTLVGWAVALAMAVGLGTTQPSVQAATPDAHVKICPRCAEQVKAAAMVCRYCGHEFERTDAAGESAP